MTSSKIQLQEILNDPLWIIMEVTMKLKSCLMRFSSTSQYYRLLSQSEYTFGKKSNRLFFKNTFSHGLYRMSIAGDKVKFIFLLKLKNEDSKPFKTMELMIRSKRLINSSVSIYFPYQMNGTERLLLTSKNGINEYRKILGFRGFI
jgi:hypothetical protein